MIFRLFKKFDDFSANDDRMRPGGTANGKLIHTFIIPDDD